MNIPLVPMANEAEAREILVGYLTHQAALEPLLEYIATAALQLAEGMPAPRGFREFVDDVQLSLDEYTGGYRHEDELREMLRDALQLSTYTLVSPPQAAVRTDTVSRSSTLELALT